MTLPQAVDLFLLDQQLRGSTEKTISGFRGFLNLFTAWLTTQGVTVISEVTLHYVQQYQLYLGSRPCDNKPRLLTRRTVRTYMSHIRMFLSYCFAKELLPRAIHLQMQLPRTEKPLIEILTDEEATRLLGCFGDEPHAHRNRAVICLMLDSGLRLSEVAGIRVGDINQESDYIKVTGKGRKTRIVPIGQQVGALLQPCIRRHVGNTPLFMMTANAIAKMIVRLKEKSGITRLHAHLLRHTFATNFLIHQLGDVYELSRILGHSDIKITEGYVQLADYYKFLKKRKHQTYLDIKEPRKSE